ncbi:MAG TPA: Mur ligase family protein [Holophagaceae bacterium]|nr:Mur ligase family protein [Holophagaceae bacterium]
MVKALGWPEGPVCARAHAMGAALAFAAPEDQLYTATEVNEWAWVAALLPSRRAEDEILFAPGHPAALDEASALQTLSRLAKAEADPRRMDLLRAAEERGVQHFLDEEQLTLGAGTGSRTWPMEALPRAEEVPWPALHGIPTALITGSNGKTTTVRLVAAMGKAHGWVVGHSCTDGVFVDGDWIARGDYSGPTGSRQVLRDARVQAAVLETARGGILRRGIATARAEAAILTNVTPDHFGEYGIHTLDDLADAKLAVTRALGPDGLLVLNADDETLLRKSSTLSCALAWFSLDDAHPKLAAHRGMGGMTCGVAGGHLWLNKDGQAHDLGAVAEMPLMAGGAAAYNLANAAGAALVATALGILPVTIAAVLARFGASRADNPGRFERWNLGGLTVVMDYAHNPEGLAALLDVARSLTREGRLGLLLGQAGNREDGAIRALAAAAAAADPDFVVLKDLDGYLRGREPGEVPAILGDELARRGLPPDRMATVLPEVAAAGALLGWAHAGDVLVLPVHELASRERVAAWLEALAAAGWAPGSPLQKIAPDEA